MTTEERNERWHQIFDRYDRAIAESRSSTRTLAAGVATQLAALMTHLDEVATRVDHIATAVHEANAAALALYRDERE